MGQLLQVEGLRLMSDEDQKLDAFLQKLEQGGKDSDAAKLFDSAKRKQDQAKQKKFTPVNPSDYEWGGDDYASGLRYYGANRKDRGPNGKGKYSGYPNVYFCDEDGEPIAYVGFFSDRWEAEEWIEGYCKNDDDYFDRFIIEEEPMRRGLRAFDIETGKPMGWED